MGLGDVRICQMLVESMERQGGDKAKVYSSNHDGQTPLHLALVASRTELPDSTICDILLQYFFSSREETENINVDAQSVENLDTVLHLAVRGVPTNRLNIAICMKLLDLGANIYLQNRKRTGTIK